MNIVPNIYKHHKTVRFLSFKSCLTDYKMDALQVIDSIFFNC